MFVSDCFAFDSNAIVSQTSSLRQTKDPDRLSRVASAVVTSYKIMESMDIILYPAPSNFTPS